MSQYTSYPDQNGVRWTIATGARAMLATVLDDAEPKYIPPAEDLADVVTVETGDAERAEAERATFVRLRGKIDAYAAAHKDSTGLSVRSSPSSGLLWVVVAILILGARRGR